MAFQSRVRSIIASVAIGLACSAAAPKPNEAVPPLPPELIEQISKAIPGGKLKDSTPAVEQAIQPILAEATLQKPERLIPLVALREFTRYFGRLPKPTTTDVATMQWLLTKPKLLETLMLAVSDRDTPDKVLPLLTSLRQDQGDKLEEFPDLTAAMCVVWDQPFTQARSILRAVESKTANFQQPRTLMRYYINARAQLRFNPQQLPWQLAAYMVDNVADAQDIEFAAGKYGGRAKIGSVFFDVVYDTEMLEGTSLGRMNDKSYSLANIFKEGGICGDQAYYAAQVSRSVGVPAIICTGINANEGTGHAWVGFLSARGTDAIWDFEEGRYPENRYWRGNAIDPQTRDRITDGDISMLADLMPTPARDRMSSTALVKVSDMVSASQQPANLMQAVNLSPGNRPAWRQLAQLAAQQKLSQKELTSFGAAVSKYAVKDFPDFAFSLLKVANSGRATDQQIKALQEMEQMFNSRPDLQAEVYLTLGDLYRTTKRPNNAYMAYSHVLDRFSNVSPIVMEAMDRIDGLMREMKALRELAGVYGDVWRRMPQPDATVAVRGTPFYRLGQRYETLLLDLGDNANAQNVRSRLDALSATIVSTKKASSR